MDKQWQYLEQEVIRHMEIYHQEISEARYGTPGTLDSSLDSNGDGKVIIDFRASDIGLARINP